MMPHNRSQKLQISAYLLPAALLLVALVFAQTAEAGQGCPFDDGSCQEYCSQQGCNMGYCGHFAWIQCICRKCGDEWSWYDKVRYNPDKAVNQTELDSLKLNGTTTLILTSGSDQQLSGAKSQPSPQPKASTGSNNNNKQAATLTTLLIPDLSDTNGKLDLNDIPDENSDKFLDYLAKNHEKLVQATSSRQQQQQAENQEANGGQEGDDDDDEVESSGASGVSTTSAPTEDRDDETIEIQISSSNNNNTSSPPTPTSTASPKLSTEQQQQQVVSSSAAPTVSSPPAAASPSQQQQQQPKQQSPVTRLLRMAVVERDLEEID